jgi:hypothetical protein
MSECIHSSAAWLIWSWGAHAPAAGHPEWSSAVSVEPISRRVLDFDATSI